MKAKKISLMQYRGEIEITIEETFIWAFYTYMNSQYLWNELSRKNVDNAWKWTPEHISVYHLKKFEEEIELKAVYCIIFLWIVLNTYIGYIPSAL